MIESIETVKNDIEELIGKKAIIKYSLGRNKYEKYNVIIKGAYNYVFIVETNGTTKSFSYVDVLTKNVKISLKNIDF